MALSIFYTPFANVQSHDRTSDFYLRKIDGEQEETDLVEGAERDKR